MASAEASRAPRPDRRIHLIAIAAALLIPVLVTLTAEVRYVTTDPQGSLLVAEQILTNGTIALDDFGPEVTTGNWRTFTHDGSTYYYFPLGTSVAALPLVAGALLAGLDLPADDALLQVAIAALLAGVSVLLMILIARQFLGVWTSIALSLLFWSGSMMASTGATALWSHDFAVVLGLVALLLLVRTTRHECRWCWLPLGATLFLAYLTRPTMWLLAVAVIAYLGFTARRTAILTGLVLAALLVSLSGFSLATFDSLLPPYYLPQRLSADVTWASVTGNLVSPGRGLLFFMPVLLALPLLAWATPSNVRQRWGLLLVALGWPVVHLIAVSRLPNWYGGYAYGPRLLMDALPGLFLATVLLWPPTLSSRRARLAAGAWLGLALAGVWIHSVNGLHNPYGQEWNWGPNIDTEPSIVWDWRYPQFLHDEQRHAQRLADYGLSAPVDG